MTTPDTPPGARDERAAIVADQEHARLLAIEALQHGRLEMGLGFCRLALNAARAARAIPYVLADPATLQPVPVVGTTRDEQPAWCDQGGYPHTRGPAGCGTHWPQAEQPARHPGPDATLEERNSWLTANGYPPEDAPTSIFNAVDTASMPAPRSSRCQGPQRGLPEHKCWGPVYFEQDPGVWRHVNPPLDADHTPIPREEDAR